MAKIEVLSGRTQLLKKPQMWIGSMDPITKEMFITHEDKIEYKEVTYIPALKKIIDEILDNALDILVEKCKSSGEIKVKLDDSSITIEDNGPGIPVKKYSKSDITDTTLPKEVQEKITNSYIPELAWTMLFTGSNFSNDAGKETIGNHGVGSKAANVFSIKFIGRTDDGNKSCKVVCENNMETTNTKIGKSSGKTGTSVEFYPDFKRFNLQKLEQVYYDLVYQRLICLSICFPDIKFSFNGKRIKMTDKMFAKIYQNNYVMQSFDTGFIAVYPNESDEFNYFTYVNGLHFIRGGSHIDYIANEIVGPIKDKLSKKYKTIKPGDIKNKLTLMVFLRGFTNLKFDSQTKETLTNSISEVSSQLKDKIDFEDLTKKILKCEDIINPIVDTFKIKEELKHRQEIRKSKKEKIRSDKYTSPIGEKKYFFMTEGDSACGQICGALGRNGNGFYSMRGKGLNVWRAKPAQIVANTELKEIANIINMPVFREKGEQLDISFEKLVITSDYDMAGHTIAGILFGWFAKFAPELFKEKRICRLRTPVIVLRDKRSDEIKHYFFTIGEYNTWCSKNDTKKYNVVFMKGLGSWEKEDFIKLFESKPFEYFVEPFIMDEQGMKIINDWLGNENVDIRREYLQNCPFDLNLI